ncbi:MAG TPA: MFS transporter, partial [Micromonosporaceae bacterium]
GPFVGVFLDRWSRRQVLMIANLLRAGLVLPSAWLVWRGEEGGWLVIAALAVIALNRFFLAGLSAALPHVVDEPRLVTANSFATTLGSATYSAGLAIATVVFHLTGTGLHPYGLVAGAAAVWYGLSASLTAASFRIDALGPDDTEAVRGSIIGGLVANARGMVAGLRHLRERPSAATVVVVQAAHRGLYGVLAIATLLLYRNYYYATADPTASMSGLVPVAAAAAAGALIAAVITPPATRRYGGWQWVTALMAALAVSVPALGLPFQAVLTVAAAATVSVVTQGVKIVADTALQVQCHDDFRGRVFSVNDTAINLPFVAGLFVGAFLLPANGRSAGGLIALGAGYAVLAVWFGWTSARLDHRARLNPTG